MTTVSIIIPACNAERTLRETLESIAPRSLPPAEVIVIDDGSRDATSDVARSFGTVHLIRQENAGPGAALNAGVAMATGGVLIFLDADDLLGEDALGAHLRALEEHPDWDGAVGHFEEFVCPAESPEAALRFLPRGRQPCWLAGGTALRTEAFRKVGPFDARLRAGHWLDWMDRARLAGLRFGVHEATVLRRRLHTASLSMQSEIRNGKGLILAARNALLRRKGQHTGQGLADGVSPVNAKEER